MAGCALLYLYSDDAVSRSVAVSYKSGKQDSSCCERWWHVFHVRYVVLVGDMAQCTLLLPV